ncbi:MAG: VWA domain-containing protein [Oscillospiraceae bacterium]|nr:VWA domain-containing protein [Oscillospiraceae bacterium]
MADNKGMGEIKTPIQEEDINRKYLEETYKLKRRGSGKRSEDIPIDDVLVDDMIVPTESGVSDGTAENDSPLSEDENAGILSEEEEIPEPVFGDFEEENEPASESNLPNDEKSESDADFDIEEKEMFKPLKATKSKKLRKKLGLDDNLAVTDGSDVAAEKKRRKRNHYIDSETRGKRIRALCAVGAVIAVVYVCILGAVSIINKDYYEDVTTRLETAEVKDEIVAEAESYYIDSDWDGLTDDFETNTLKTDPNNSDSDSDGASDGIEFICGTDPLDSSDGGGTDFERQISAESVVLTVNGSADNVSTASIDTINSGISRYPGVVSSVYSVSGISGSADLKINCDDEENVGIFCLDTSDSSISEVDSSVGNGYVETEITSDGAYFAANRSTFNDDAGIDVMFVIDNSGSMYSKTVISGSEENDVEFKRVLLSEDLVDSFDDSVRCGVAKFTASYTLISGITFDKDIVKESLETIKNGSENFDGTDFAGAILKAADEFQDESRRRFIILITDGLPSEDSFKVNEQTAIDTCAENNISVISISLGNDTDVDYLSKIAEETNGVFYRAFNADSFAEIETKIEELLYSGGISVSGDGDEAVSVSLIADAGFGGSDCIKAAGLPTTLSISGSLVGSAIVNKLYYTGSLTPANAEYHLADNDFFANGKDNLGNCDIPSISLYNSYLSFENKWNFSSKGDVLKYTSDAHIWLSDNGFSYVETELTGEIPQSDTLLMLRKITFQQLRDYTYYEKAVINIDALQDSEQQIFRCINYYDNSDNYRAVSFGSEGEAAFDLLISELSNGIPSVLVTDDGTVFNASKISNNSKNANQYIIEAYNLSSPESAQTIYISKQDIYYSAESDVQFKATIAGDETELYILE